MQGEETARVSAIQFQEVKAQVQTYSTTSTSAGLVEAFSKSLTKHANMLIRQEQLGLENSGGPTAVQDQRKTARK